MTLGQLKANLRKIDSCFAVDKITILDVAESNLSPELGRKIEGLRLTEQQLERIRTCRNAGDVMSEFAVDAASAKVDEMIFAGTSQDRQRAQETILEYALGKPINRNMSWNMNVSDAKDEELDQTISQLLVELGFESAERAASALLIGEKKPDRSE